MYSFVIQIEVCWKLYCQMLLGNVTIVFHLKKGRNLHEENHYIHNEIVFPKFIYNVFDENHINYCSIMQMTVWDKGRN